MSFGKIFESTFTGSMVGSGPTVFAVWAYVIANTKPPGVVEINPVLLAAALGTTAEDVNAALQQLQSPDQRSRSQVEEGRRLVASGAFLYRVPSWHKYRDSRNDEERRAYNAKAQARSRAKRSSINQSMTVNDLSSPSAQAEAEAEAEDRSREEDLASSEDLGKVNTEVLTSAIPRARHDTLGTAIGQNPHSKPTNLINGAELRRHGQHRWCDHDRGMCVPYALHENFQKRGQKSDSDLLAWYPTVIAKMNGQPLGDDLFDFWRNQFGAWVGLASKKSSSFETKNDRRKRVFNEFREKHRGQ